MTEINAGYVNHVGSTRDGRGNLFAVITQDGPGGGDTDVIIKRCLSTADPSLAASWEEVKRWTEQADGKPGYGSAEVLGNLFVAILSQRNAAGQVVVRVHTVTGIAEAGSGDSGGGGTPAPASGAYVEAPGGAIRVFARGPFAGEQTIDLDPYGVPPASAVNVQITASASVAGRRGCVGGKKTSTGMVKVASAEGAPGIRAYNSGLVAPGEGNTIVLMTEGGELAELHLDILGWIY